MERGIEEQPATLNGRLQNKIVDFEVIAREVERNERLSPETIRVIAAGRALARDAGPLTETIEIVRSALSGSAGVRSPRFLRRINEIRRSNVVDLHPDLDPEPTGAAQRAA